MTLSEVSHVSPCAMANLKVLTKSYVQVSDFLPLDSCPDPIAEHPHLSDLSSSSTFGDSRVEVLTWLR